MARIGGETLIGAGLPTYQLPLGPSGVWFVTLLLVGQAFETWAMSPCAPCGVAINVQIVSRIISHCTDRAQHRNKWEGIGDYLVCPNGKCRAKWSWVVMIVLCVSECGD